MDYRKDLSNSEEILSSSDKELIPWSYGPDDENILKTQTKESAKTYLDSFYLYPLDEINIDNNCDDITGFINERYQVILSAAYLSGVSVAMIFNGKNGKTKVYIGLRKDLAEKNDSELFLSIVNGVFPSKNISFKQSVSFSSFSDGFSYGGVLTGIPILKNEDEKQKFNISSVLRSLFGKEFLLAIISKPVSPEVQNKSLKRLMDIKDKLHSVAKVTENKEKGSGESKGESSQSTTASKTSTHGLNLILYNYSRNKPLSESSTKGEIKTLSNSQSESLSIEKQNSYALELEKVAEQQIARLIKGMNSGFWETAITFVAHDKVTCDILGGAFLGELSKPSNTILPPPRLYIDTIPEEKKLFLPIPQYKNLVFPSKLASYITGEELSLISSPPKDSVPGYEIRKMPALALTDMQDTGEIIIGNITDHSRPINNNFFSLSNKDLNKHLFVCGLTGSGKTSTIKHILKNLAQAKNKIPFLILESAKRDYRQLLGDNIFKGNLDIFTIGDATVSPIRFNPFYIQKGVLPLVHIDFLKAIFNASFSLYGPMPHIVEKCLHNIYLKRGWNLTTGEHPHFMDKTIDYYKLMEHHYCFPTLNEFKDEIDNYVQNEIGYQGELRDNIRSAIITRIESLCVGTKGLMFNTYDFYPIEELLKKNTIFEMENLADDDDKAFFVGLILVLISEYRQKDNPAINPGKPSKGLSHFLVIEEAHRLLKNVEVGRTSEMMGNPKGKAVEVFCNVISEMRSLGQGVGVVEQIPTKISPDVIKNSNTKIVHRLVSKDDQALLAGSLGISDDDALYLNRLNTGHGLCHKEGMERPVECKVNIDFKSYAISDDNIRNIMKSKTSNLHYSDSYELSGILKEQGRILTEKFLNSLCVIGPDRLKDLVTLLNKKLNELCLLLDMKSRFNESIFPDFVTKQILESLSRGIYSQKQRLPENIKLVLMEVLTTPNNVSYERLMKILAQFWKIEKPKFFIIDVVENLTIKYLNKNKYSPTYEKAKETVTASFLLCGEDLIGEIAQRIANRKVG